MTMRATQFSEQITYFKDYTHVVLSGQAAEVVATYWLSVLAVLHKEEIRHAIVDDLVELLSTQDWSHWQARSEQLIYQIELMRKSVTLARHTFFHLRVDLDPSMDEDSRTIAIIAKAAAHYAGIDDTDKLTIDTLILALSETKLRSVTTIHSYCDLIPVTEYSEPIRTGGCAPVLLACFLIATTGGVLLINIAVQLF